MIHYTPVFTSELEPGYVTVYGSTLHHSRVGGRAKSYTRFSRAPAGWSAEVINFGTKTPRSPDLVPRFVVVSPNGEHIIVDRHLLQEIRDGSGALRFVYRSHDGLSYVTAADRFFYVGGQERRWDDPRGDGSGQEVPDHVKSGGELAVRVNRARRTTIFNTGVGNWRDPHGTPGWPPRPRRHADEGVGVLGSRFIDPRPDYPNVGQDMDFHEEIEAVGTSAAISGDWHAVIGTAADRSHTWSEDKQGWTTTEVPPRLIVLAPVAGERLRPVHLADVKLPYRPDLLSIIPPLVLILSNADQKSTLHAVDGAGREQWSATLPFKALQPPIDGADGRVVVAGHGLAAVESGRVVWSFLWEQPILATAFVDGTLAVATGRELRILDRAGQTRQTFQVEPGEEITTPPAIAADGAVWVATPDALYVAR